MRIRHRAQRKFLPHSLPQAVGKPIRIPCTQKSLRVSRGPAARPATSQTQLNRKPCRPHPAAPKPPRGLHPAASSAATASLHFNGFDGTRLAKCASHSRPGSPQPSPAAAFSPASAGKSSSGKSTFSSGHDVFDLATSCGAPFRPEGVFRINGHQPQRYVAA